MNTETCDNPEDKLEPLLEEAAETILESDDDLFVCDLDTKKIIDYAKSIGRDDLATKLLVKELEGLERRLQDGGTFEDINYDRAAEIALEFGDTEKHEEYKRKYEEYKFRKKLNIFKCHTDTPEEAETFTKVLARYGIVDKAYALLGKYPYKELIALSPKEIEEEFELWEAEADKEFQEYIHGQWKIGKWDYREYSQDELAEIAILRIIKNNEWEKGHQAETKVGLLEGIIRRIQSTKARIATALSG